MMRELYYLEKYVKYCKKRGNAAIVGGSKVQLSSSQCSCAACFGHQV